MKFAMGIDNIHGRSADKALLDECVKIVESKGHTVINLGVGPNVVQSYSLRNSSDVMVQIAGGMCIGTLADFYIGMKNGYYHASKGCIPYYTKGWTKYDPRTWKAVRAWDDRFSHGLDLSSYLGKTLPTIYSEKSDRLLPFSYGTTAQALMDMMLGSSTSNATGTTGNSGGGGGGNTGLDLIKQVVTPWDKHGVKLELNGLTLEVSRATTKNAPILHENIVLNDSVSITDYNSDTPNYINDGKNIIKNDFLIERFGKIEPDEKCENKGKVWIQDMYQIAQRESGHSIELKCLFDPELKEGIYVHLQLPSFDIDGYYFVSKTNVEEESNMSVTLEPAPPSRYQEVTETVVNNNTGSSTTSKDPIAIGNELAAKYGFCSSVVCPKPGGGETYAAMKSSGSGSCWAWSDALYTELNKAGIKARIIQYATSMARNHRSVQIMQNGSWVDYPYRSTNISKYARNTTTKAGMFEYKAAP